MKRSGLILVILFLFSTPSFSQTPVSFQTGQKEHSTHSVEAVSHIEARSLSDVNLSFLKQGKDSMEWGRDPFVLPVRPTGEPYQVANQVEKQLSLSAIIYNNGTGAAIINGRIVRKGDQIEGMEIGEIHPDRVLLREGLRNLELRVDPFLSK